MVRGFRWFGAVAGLGLLGCSGVNAGDASVRERTGIIRGQPDTTTHAVIGMLIGEGTLCTGSLIAPNLVLTARHCVSDSGDQNGAIECGVSMFGPHYDTQDFVVTWDADLTDGTPASQAYGVSEIRTPTPSPVCGNDIALMILDESVAASAATPLEPRVNEVAETDEVFDAIGYGIQDPSDDTGQTAGVRMRASNNRILCVGSTECRGTEATNSEWVAESAICQGDSGGPALDSEKRVIGVTSRSNEDCSAGLYTGVTAFKALIVDAAIAAAEAGGYDPPEWAGGAIAEDAGSPTDAGTPPDAGAAMDAGTPPDAGSDAGVPPRPDAGPSNDAGSPSDAGTPPRPDAGMIDAGTPDSGSAGRDAGSTPDASTPGTPGSLGDSCNNECSGGYVCYADDGEPPGICVPRCTAADRDCPDGYRCATSLNACVPEQEDDDEDDDDDNGDSSSCTCSMRPVSSGMDRMWGSLAVAGALAVGLRRRRRVQG